MATKRSKVIDERAPSAYSAQDAIDFLMTIPEIKESFTRADIELAIDDQGWERFGNNIRNITEMDAVSRSGLISRARLYWQHDPLAHQAVRLWTDYAIGTGISYKCEDQAIQDKLTKFCRMNRKIMGKQGQQRSSKKCLIDGDVFFAIFGAEGEDKTIRYVEALQITDVISDPDDEDHTLAFKRVTAKNKALYYASWDATEEDRALAEQQKDPLTNGKISLEEDVVMYQVAFDQIYKRGNGLLNSSVDWSREHRRFMAARVAIIQALSKFAWKHVVKGGQAKVDKVVAGLQSSLHLSGTAGGAERNPQPAPGSSWVSNEGIDTTPMPRATGAGDARNDGDSLKLMVCAGTNIMLHYFGDPSTGNLATATAMELPMKKGFEGYQELWKDVYRDIFAIVLDEKPDGEPAVIDIDMPPILQEDLQKLGAYITQFTTTFPEAKVPEVLQMLLIAMGINNIEDVMKNIKAKRKEIDAQQAKVQELQAQNPPVVPANSAQAAALKESYDNLAAAFLRLEAKL